MKFLSNSPKETQKIATKLAHKILKTKKGAVIALEGELGAGKTTFVKGFAKAFGIKSKIKSPTFVLMKKYKVAQGTNLYHLDCYRVRNYKDLRIPELKEIFYESHYNVRHCTMTHIVLIEWAERVREILPKKHITVHIDHISENVRKIKIDNF
ncbi:MAG: tRNA (adenosine(37)-N6)-threonylcarbamoyltransferase complex ATPase subunit type 1 TsaE [Patescibacteria group bacterium]